MMNKEQFIKRIKLIQTFQSQQNSIATLIEAITDGYAIVIVGDILISEMVMMIEEDLGYKNILDWWLESDVEKIIYNLDGSTCADVAILDSLYDYMVTHQY